MNLFSDTQAGEPVEVQSAEYHQGCAALSASLHGMSPRWLRFILQQVTPETFWELLSYPNGNVSFEKLQSLLIGDGRERGTSNDYDVANSFAMLGKIKLRWDAWRQQAHNGNPLRSYEAYAAQNISICTVYDGIPDVLKQDEYAPVVLFAKGNLRALRNRMVAIIGTRRCTPQGSQIARDFGRTLSENGVSVVSGLALGIDGAAHVGALESAFGAPPVCVIGSGLDVIYPRKHKQLYEQIISAGGVMLSEAPLGSSPEKWRFPARNRIIASLSEVVVVVESHQSGGALHTVNEAVQRNKSVMSVPGSIVCGASAGTNQLLVDGFQPATCPQDVLRELQWLRPVGANLAGDALARQEDRGGLVCVESAQQEVFLPGTAEKIDKASDLSADYVAILELIESGIGAVPLLVELSGMSVIELSSALHDLRSKGLVCIQEGQWCRTMR